MNNLSASRRLVVKVGTSTLAYANGRLNIRRVQALARVLSDIKNSGREVLLVTSGAIGVGAGQLGLKERPHDIGGKQAAAAVGQCELMYTYDKLFSEYGHQTAQVLLTRDVVEDPRRKQNVVNTLTRLMEFGVLPIVNENDTVAIDEINAGDSAANDHTFSENDTLSAIVAVLAQADALVILSDIDGLYTDNPRKNSAARRIDVVEEITDELLAAAKGAGSALGTGGMGTKLHAAQMATAAGIPTAIINGERPENLYDLLDGKAVGTIFTVKETAK